MITNRTHEQEEDKIAEIFRSAGWSDIPEPNLIRIDNIEKRALHEQAAKESISFVFNSFSEVLYHFTGTFFDTVPTQDKDYQA